MEKQFLVPPLLTTFAASALLLTTLATQLPPESATTLSPVRALESQAGKPLSVAWSPDGTVLASGGKETAISVWLANTGELLQLLRRRPEGRSDWQRGITSLAFSPDGQLLASGGEDGLISLWGLQNGKLIRTLRGHTDPVHSVGFGPNGQLLASASGGGFDFTMRLWSVPTGTLLKKVDLQGIGFSVAFSGDGRMVAGAAWDQVHVFRSQNVDRIGAFLGGNKHQAAEVVVFSPDGKVLTTAGDEGIVRGWVISSGESSFTLTKDLPKGETDRILALAYSPDGDTLISGSEGGMIQIWNVKQRRLLSTAKLELGHQVWVGSLAFSRDCRSLAAASTDGVVRIWSIARTGSGKPPTSKADCSGAADLGYSLRAAGHLYRVKSLAGSDGNRVFVFFDEKGAPILDASLLKQLAMGAWTRESIVASSAIRPEIASKKIALQGIIGTSQAVQRYEIVQDALARAMAEAIEAAVTGGASLSNAVPNLTRGILRTQLTNSPRTLFTLAAQTGLQRSLDRYKQLEAILPPADSTALDVTTLGQVKNLYAQAQALALPNEALAAALMPKSALGLTNQALQSVVSELLPGLPTGNGAVTFGALLDLQKSLAQAGKSLPALQKYDENLNLALHLSEANDRKIDAWATQAAEMCSGAGKTSGGAAPSVSAGPVPEGPITSVGGFKNECSASDLPYCYSVDLWRQGDIVFGLFTSALMDADNPTGLLEDTKFEPQTGRLSFKARLSIGEVAPGKPSRDLFEFAGKLEKLALVGTLKISDPLRPTTAPTTRSVRFQKQKTPINTKVVTGLRQDRLLLGSHTQGNQFADLFVRPRHSLVGFVNREFGRATEEDGNRVFLPVPGANLPGKVGHGTRGDIEVR
jgi:WD40 repeat protein